MQVIMDKGATLKEIGRVIMKIEDKGYKPFVAKDEKNISISVPSIEDNELFDEIRKHPNVLEVKPFSKPYRLVSREFLKNNTVVAASDVQIGGEEIILMAGPRAVESRNQLFESAERVKAAGARILRGGAFKPRTSPYGFQGLKTEGLKLLAEARGEFELKIVTEVIMPDDVELVSKYADILQVGARNMQNYALLERLGKSEKPVLLKRGMMSTVEEFLMSAEYIVSGGNPNVILCERGIRTFERQTRFTLDISAVPVLKEISHLPVIVDPSHAAGNSRYVEALSFAAIAAGADGLIVEVHPRPKEALCDGPQSMTPDAFEAMAMKLKGFAEAAGRKL